MWREGIEAYQQGDESEWQISAFLSDSGEPLTWYLGAIPELKDIVCALTLWTPEWSDHHFRLTSFKAGEGTAEKPAVFVVTKIGPEGIMSIEVEANRLPARRQV